MSLERLLCRARPTSICYPYLNQIGQYIASLERVCVQQTRRAYTAHDQIITPYIARSLMESVSFAVLFRVDPFRAVSAARFVEHQSFDPNAPMQHSISWQHDVISEGGAQSDIWNPGLKPEKISRSIFSEHQISLRWKPGIEEMLDRLDVSLQPQDIDVFLNSVPEDAVRRIRGELKQLYSFFSKGVHGEYFITRAMPDQETFHQKINRVLVILYQVALASNFIPDFADRISPSLAGKVFTKGLEKVNG